MKNLFRTFLLLFLAVIALLAMRWLPTFSVGGWHSRGVNILADICAVAPKKESDKDLESLKAEMKLIDNDECKTDSSANGELSIKDYSDSTGRHGMANFYGALRESDKRIVRIAFFGDSFVEGDLVTSTLRNLLQNKYGGSGVGFVNMSSLTSGFRNTVVHRHNGWKYYSVGPTTRAGCQSALLGITGEYFVADSAAWSEFVCQRSVYAQRLQSADIAKLYYRQDSIDSCTYIINGRDSVTCDDEMMGNVAVKTWHGNIRRVKIEPEQGMVCYGVAMEGRTGVVVDNFSMRGSGGTPMSRIPMSTLFSFARLRPYDLIIFQYGLNVASDNVRDYSGYTKQFSHVIDRFKTAYPDASILVMSMPDRDERDSAGVIRTMDCVKRLVYYQKKMAYRNKVAFWNMYEAMGGENSMLRMQKEGKANLDYTHLTFRGGRYVGELLFKALTEKTDK